MTEKKMELEELIPQLIEKAYGGDVKSQKKLDIICDAQRNAFLHAEMNMDEMDRVDHLYIEDLIEAAHANDHMAQLRLSCLYRTGVDTRRSPKKAFEWLQKSAALGNWLGRYNEAASYFEGMGIERDVAKSFDLFLNLAEGGNPVCQLQVAEMLWKGKGVKKCKKTALEYIKISALGGYGRAKQRLYIIKMETKNEQ